MSADQPGGSLESSNELATTRTVLAAERTLMAWVRTALSMISFGFTIYKFLHGLQEAGGIRLRHPEEPRNIGIFLAALGSASLLAGILEHLQTLRGVEGAGRRLKLGATFFTACVVLVLGLVVFAGLVTQRGPL